jgi:hypothetical protein
VSLRLAALFLTDLGPQSQVRNTQVGQVLISRITGNLGTGTHMVDYPVNQAQRLRFIDYGVSTKIGASLSKGIQDEH